MILVGHSGAGPLIPVVCDALTQPVAACVFVDAGLPVAGASRLDMIRREMPEIAESFAAVLREGGSYPNWTDEALRESISNAVLRRQVLDDMNPRGLDFPDEAIPVPDDWPDCPCTYLQFSPGYDFSAQEAVDQGWPVARLDGGHFHMLVDQVGVTEAILSLIASFENP